MNNGNSGYNPGMNNGNNGYNPGYVAASTLPAGIEFDNSNGNSGYNPGMNNGNNGFNPGYVAASNLPAGIEFDNSNGNSGYNPGNSYTPLPGSGNCYNVCGRNSRCPSGMYQVPGGCRPICRSKCDIKPACV